MKRSTHQIKTFVLLIICLTAYFCLFANFKDSAKDSFIASKKTNVLFDSSKNLGSKPDTKAGIH
jgi:hypothetical protein